MQRPIKLPPTGGRWASCLPACFFSRRAYIIFASSCSGSAGTRQNLDWTVNPLVRSTGIDRVLMPFVLLGRYLVFLIAPLKLSLDYGTHVIGWQVDWRQPYVYLGFATFAAAVLALVLAMCRKNWVIVLRFLRWGCRTGW